MSENTPKPKRRFRKAMFITLAIVLAGLAIFIYVQYYFVFGTGVKTGTLNYVVYKGYIFKTYEGKLIQAGFRGGAPGAIQSYEFEFSVSDKGVAERLMLSGGAEVELHYKEYKGALPWRGYSKYVVDSIVSIHKTPVMQDLSTPSE